MRSPRRNRGLEGVERGWVGWRMKTPRPTKGRVGTTEEDLKGNDEVA